VSDKIEILKAERAAFDEWNRARYHNHSISGDGLAWSAWQAGIAHYLKDQLDENSDLSDRCLITMSRGWAKKMIRAFREAEEAKK
jgi:hypothetical protein